MGRFFTFVQTQGKARTTERSHTMQRAFLKKKYVVIVFLSGFCWYKIINNW